MMTISGNTLRASFLSFFEFLLVFSPRLRLALAALAAGDDRNNTRNQSSQAGPSALGTAPWE